MTKGSTATRMIRLGGAAAMALGLAISVPALADNAPPPPVVNLDLSDSTLTLNATDPNLSLSNAWLVELDAHNGGKPLSQISQSNNGQWQLSQDVSSGWIAAVVPTGNDGFYVSNTVPWKEPDPSPGGQSLDGPHASIESPGATTGHFSLRAADLQGQLNGPTCGSLTVQSDNNGGYEAVWTQCPSVQDGQLVILVGAQPGPNGTNPFDNPANVEGIWYGYVSNGQVTIDMGSTNNVTNDPITNNEWFAMSVFSSSVESPAGQLPEVPYAAALPLLMAAPVAWFTLRKRQVGI